MSILQEPYDELATAVARIHQHILADTRTIQVLREELLKLREEDVKLRAAIYEAINSLEKFVIDGQQQWPKLSMVVEIQDRLRDAIGAE